MSKNTRKNRTNNSINANDLRMLEMLRRMTPEQITALTGVAAAATAVETKAEAEAPKAEPVMAGNTAIAARLIEEMELLNGDDMYFSNKEELIAAIIAGKCRIISKASETKRKIAVNLQKEDKTVAIYSDESGNLLAKINLAALYVDAEKAQAKRDEVEAKEPSGIRITAAGAADAVKKSLQKVQGKPEVKPQAKTFGQKVKNAAAASTEKVEQKVEKAEEPKAETAKGFKKLEQQAYEKLLIDGINAINSEDVVMHGGTTEIKVPTQTKDGSTWKVVEINRLSWRFQNLRFKDVFIDISTYDVQWARDMKA